MQTFEAAGSPPAYVLDPVAAIRGGEFDPATQNHAIQVRFFLDSDPRPDGLGNPVIDSEGNIATIEMVEIINVNDPKNTGCEVVTDLHRYKLYPREYAAFRQGADAALTGTPVKVWLGDNHRTRDLAEWHVHTVEQLCALTDQLCASIGPGTYDLRRRAQTWLAARKDSALADRVAAENEALTRKNQALEDRMARLEAMLAAGEMRAAAVQEPQEHPATLEPVSHARKGK